MTKIARLDNRDWRAIPDNVRTAISTRLNELSALGNRMLVAAAIIGREFDFPLLRASLSTVDEEALLKTIDEGLKALVIEPLPSRGDEWYQFRHAANSRRAVRQDLTRPQSALACDHRTGTRETAQ